MHSQSLTRITLPPSYEILVLLIFSYTLSSTDNYVLIHMSYFHIICIYVRMYVKLNCIIYREDQI